MKASINISETNIKKLLNNIVVLVDTREQENKHIIDYLEKNKIKWKKKKLEFGDYSCCLEKEENLGLPFDITLENRIAIERKGSSGRGLNELSSNLTADRSRIENEFIRSHEFCENFILVVENGSWEDIKNGVYRSNYNPNAFYNTLISWRKKYNFQIDFVKGEHSAEHILRLLTVNLKKILEE